MYEGKRECYKISEENILKNINDFTIFIIENFDNFDTRKSYKLILSRENNNSEYICLIKKLENNIIKIIAHSEFIYFPKNITYSVDVNTKIYSIEYEEEIDGIMISKPLEQTEFSIKSFEVISH